MLVVGAKSPRSTHTILIRQELGSRARVLVFEEEGIGAELAITILAVLYKESINLVLCNKLLRGKDIGIGRWKFHGFSQKGFRQRGNLNTVVKSSEPRWIVFDAVFICLHFLYKSGKPLLIVKNCSVEIIDTGP